MMMMILETLLKLIWIKNKFKEEEVYLYSLPVFGWFLLVVGSEMR